MIHDTYSYFRLTVCENIYMIWECIGVPGTLESPPASSHLLLSLI